MTIATPHRIDGLLYTGPYFSTGPRRASLWSAMLRVAKDPSGSEGGRESLHRVCDRGVGDVRARIGLLGEIDALVSVPPRMCRFRQRGMSLPDQLSRALHDSIGIHYEADALMSVVDDVELKRIPLDRRREVVSGTFAATTRKLSGKSVLLVDDIITSGATIAECARQLRGVGVNAVYVYALGRTADVALRSAGGSADQPQVDDVSLGDPPCELNRRA